jgi:NTE family protein
MRPIALASACCLISSWLGVAPARAEVLCGAPSGTRLGLALSGGGARGFAHVGVLRAFEEAGVRFDCVAGTSMGAVVGALYASGYASTHIEAVLRTLDWQRVFRGRADRSLVPAGRRSNDAPALLRVGFTRRGLRLPAGALPDQRINRTLIRELAGPGLAASGDFTRLPVPFRAVALDIRSGERMVLGQGDLARAVRASMSVPVAFAPVPWGERLLVDGGLVDNVPVDVVREMGAAHVVAVDVTSPPRRTDGSVDAIQVALQITDLLARAQNKTFGAQPDVLLRPDLGAHTFSDYAALDDLVARGYAEGQRALAALRARGQALPSGRAPAPGAPARQEAAAALEGRALVELAFNGSRHVRPELLRRLVGLRPGQPLRLREALRGLDALHASELFRFFWLRFDARADGLVATYDLIEAEPWAAELGAGWNEHDDAGAFARVRQRNLFGLGERFTLAVEASNSYEAVASRLTLGRLGALPIGLDLRLGARRDKAKVFASDGQELGRARFEQVGVSLALQRDFGRAFLLRGGFELARADTPPRPELGAGDFAAARDDLRRVGFELTWDTLDDAFAPERGGALVLAYERELPGLGASRAMWRAALRGCYVHARSSLRADLWVGLSGGRLAPYDLYRLGGPALLPGHAREQEWNRQVLAAALAWRPRVLGGLHARVRVGTGHTWALRHAMRLGDLEAGAGLGLEHDSPLGPVYAEIGRDSRGGSAVAIGVGVRVAAPRGFGRWP